MDGYTHYIYQQPEPNQLVTFMREGWEAPFVGTRKDLHPAANAYGLYWKLWNGNTINVDASQVNPRQYISDRRKYEKNMEKVGLMKISKGFQDRSAKLHFDAMNLLKLQRQISGQFKKCAFLEEKENATYSPSDWHQQR